MNSLAQTTLKMTSPGVPDFYQGCEFWDLSMVDPDNRRPVDYAKRQQALQAMIDDGKIGIEETLKVMLGDRTNPGIKLFVIHHILKCAIKNQLLFQQGSYTPLSVTGKFKNHCLAMVRKFDNINMIVVVPRFCSSLTPSTEWPLTQEVWGDTAIAMPADVQGVYAHALTQEVVHVAQRCLVGDILAKFPIAVLVTQY